MDIGFDHQANMSPDQFLEDWRLTEDRGQIVVLQQLCTMQGFLANVAIFRDIKNQAKMPHASQIHPSTTSLPKLSCPILVFLKTLLAHRGPDRP